jgi:hypothetical protein
VRAERAQAGRPPHLGGRLQVHENVGLIDHPPVLRERG